MKEKKRKRKVKYPHSIGVRLNAETYEYIERMAVRDDSDISSVAREILMRDMLDGYIRQIIKEDK